MAKKDLKYFMRTEEQEVVTVPGPSSFRDENGEVIQFEIKKLTQKEIQDINDAYRRHSIATDKKGNPLVANGEVIWKTERDSSKATRHMMVEALQYPDLKDKQLMDFYGCVDITEMPFKVFPSTDDYQYVVKIIMQALGLSSGADDGEEMEAAKN